jgi:hypothetical protein
MSCIPAVFKKMCNTWFVDTPVNRHRLSPSFEDICFDMLGVELQPVNTNTQAWPQTSAVMHVGIATMHTDCNGITFLHQGILHDEEVYMYDHINKLLCVWPNLLVKEIYDNFGTKDFKIFKHEK